jgi:hypothetical protein
MIIVAVLVGLMLIGLMVLVEFINTRDSGDMSCGLSFGVLISFLFAIEVGIVSDIIGEPKPTPMDVYRGKTTLEYTIRDGEVIDSVVVWKGDIDNED